MPRRTRITAVSLIAATAAPLLLAALSGPAAAAAAPSVVYGASGGTTVDIATNEADAGGPVVGYRAYRSWDDTLFSPGLIAARDAHVPYMSVKAMTNAGRVVSFRAIADAAPTSPEGLNLARLAEQAKAYGAPLYLAFNHEPEADHSRANGGPADFVAAWRHIHDVFAARGATNVRWTWTMTAWGFSRTDAYRAANYYPGDGYVDAIGADGYNWGTCRSTSGTWKTFAQVFAGQRAFGAAHPGKQLIAMEWGSVEDPAQPGRKAAWINDMTATLATPTWSQYHAALSWSGRHFTAAPNCVFDWKTSTSALTAWAGQIRTSAPTAS